MNQLAILSTAELMFDPVEHRYWLGPLELPALSRVLTAAGMTDFSIPCEDLLDEKKLQDARMMAVRARAKRQIGTVVHAACSLALDGVLDRSEIPDLVADDDPDRERLVKHLTGYVNAFDRWLQKYSPTLVSTEVPTYHPTDLYATTPDLDVTIAGTPTLVEIKTSWKLSAYVPVQLAGQARCLLARGLGERDRCALQLKPDGKMSYKLYVGGEHDAAFVNALAVYRWKERNKCL